LESGERAIIDRRVHIPEYRAVLLK
jgi:hypothetical protein